MHADSQHRNRVMNLIQQIRTERESHEAKMKELTQNHFVHVSALRDLIDKLQHQRKEANKNNALLASRLQDEIDKLKQSKVTIKQLNQHNFVAVSKLQSEIDKLKHEKKK